MTDNHEIPDSDWILAGADGAAAGLIKKLMKLKYQSEILKDFSEEEKSKGNGFACQVIIMGNDGGIFNICFSKEDGLQPKPLDVPVRNQVAVDEDTLLNLCIPDVSGLVIETPEGNELSGLEAFVWMIDNNHEDQLPEFKPIKTIEEVFTDQRIKFGGGDMPNIDMVKWQEIYNKALNGYAIPMMRDIMITAARKVKKDKEAV
jgi:hypothetical protein